MSEFGDALFNVFEEQKADASHKNSRWTNQFMFWLTFWIFL